jgi:hypothetical protein
MAGVRGTVVVMHNPGAVLAVADGLIFADAGLACPKLARFAANHGCSEAEFLAGIPGTVGGALAMNAGCYGGETWRFVARVEVLRRDGTFEVRMPEEYSVGYRSVRWGPTLAVAPANKAAALRTEGGPLAPGTAPRRWVERYLPQAGSVFRPATRMRRATVSGNCWRVGS